MKIKKQTSIYKQIQKAIPILIASVGLSAFIASCVTPRMVTQTALPTKYIAVDPMRESAYDYIFQEAVGLDKADARYDLLNQCVRINPTRPEAHYEMAQLQLNMGMRKKGLQSLEIAHRLQPDNYWYASALGQVYQQLDSIDLAIQVYEDMAKHHRFKAEPRFALLGFYQQKQDYDGMIQVLDTLEKLQGKSEELSMQKYRIYLQQNDSTKAFSEIDDLIEEYPYDTRFRNLKAGLLLEHNRKEEALRTFHDILKQEPSNGAARYGIASYYYQEKDTTQYELQLDTLLKDPLVAPSVKVTVLRNYVAQMTRAGKDSLIIARLDMAMQADSTDSEVPMFYTSYLVSNKMKEQAIPVLNHLLKINPENGAARLQLLQYMLQNEDKERVRALCEDGIQYHPEEILYHFYLAITYTQDKKPKDVIRICQEGQKYITSETRKEVASDMFTLQGDAYHELGEMEKCYEAYESALKIHPDNVGVLNNYAYFLALDNKNLERAEIMSQKTVMAEPDNKTYLDTYAWVLFMAGKYKDAKIYIDRVIPQEKKEVEGDAKSTEPKEGEVKEEAKGEKKAETTAVEDISPDVWEHAGDIYYMCGEKKQALKYWKKALELGSESKELKLKIKMKRYIR